MESKNNFNYIRKLSAIVGTAFVVGLTGCGNTNDVSFNDTMYGIYASTCFDELLGEEEINFISQLEEYIDISEELHDLKLEDYTSVDDYKESKLLSPEDIYYLIEEYKNNDKYTESEKQDISCKLYVQDKYVNTLLRDKGYSAVADAALAGVKATVADAAGLDEDYASSIVVMSQKEYQELHESFVLEIPIGDYDVAKCSDLKDLIEWTYKMQEQESKALKNKNERARYNSDRNNYLRKAIKCLEKCLRTKHTVDSKKRIKSK